ncbi:MAG: aldehyde ferredoxin oxidoreductase [Candidatus Heimdallarchaeota archaeon]|nr:aldehyde ferredoxin oxidoreductase [Candidatus Heimdallarchaeota archaeon]
MTIKGNTGIILEIDLTTSNIKEVEIKSEHYRKYLGGSGLAAKLFYPLLSKDLDPLSPENPLGFFTGPLVGTRAPNCGRHVVCAKSPATGIWGESNSGGKFGSYLKFLGFDALIFKGKAKKPTILKIFDEEIELQEASDLWGKNVYAFEKAISDRFDKISSFACIGQAGENLVKVASVMNDGDRAAGRTGMGAVMGSKKLKGILLRSSTRKVPVAKEEEMKELASKTRKYLRENTEARRLFGTPAYVSGGMKWGDVPVKYWYQGEMENPEAIDGQRMRDTILVKNYYCYGCAIGCGRVVEISEGKYKLPRTGGPEYETLASFGTNLLVDDLKGISYANYLCNDFGMDTISTGMIIGLVYTLYEDGIISKKELEGIEPVWGNIDPAIELIKRIGKREGLGDLLAEGIDVIADHYNVPEKAHTVNGLELPFHDPRAFFSMAAVYATSSRGACHNDGDGYKMGLGVTVPEINLECKDRFDNQEAGRLAAQVQDFRAVYNGLIMCHFAMPPFTSTIELLKLATGWDYTIAEVITAGERINNLKRLLNKKMGLTKENDRLPKIMEIPLKEGGTEGHTPDLETQLEEYYKTRKWDPETGFPTKELLEELEISEV